MTRFEAVRQVTREWGNARFSYGLFDCCQFAKDVFKAYRGFDPAPCLQYESEEEAREIIKEYGGLEGLLAHILGSPVSAHETRTADVLLLKLPKVGEIAGVCVPDGALVPLKVGLYRAPLRYALKGWRI